MLFSPILSNHLAERLLDLAGSSAQGTLHLAGSEGCAKYEFARQAAILFGFSPAMVTPVKSADLNLKIRRPLNVTLSVKKAQKLLGTPLPGLMEGLRQFQALKEKVGAPS